MSFPSHQGDNLYRRHHEATWVTPQERTPYATLLRNDLGLPTTF